MPDFSRRSEEMEIMDDLACQGEVVDQTLRELEFINRWLGGNAVTLQGLTRLVNTSSKESIHICDLGCGGGDMLILIAQWAKKKNLNVRLTGIDANPHIIAFAKENCSTYPEIALEVLDIFSPEFRARRFDIVVGTLFFHHFSQPALVDFFSHLKSQVNVGIVINDIHRHWLAYHSIRILTRLFSKSAMVKFDAPLSVLRAFSKSDMNDIITAAHLQPATLHWKWAFRWLLIYQK